MLAINQLIKIIIGVVVISVVVMGLYFFGSYVADFFGNMIGGEDEKEEGVVVKENTVGDKEEVSCESCNEDVNNLFNFNICDRDECNAISTTRCVFEKNEKLSEGTANWFSSFGNKKDYGVCRTKIK